MAVIAPIPNQNVAIRKFGLASGQTPVFGAPVLLDSSGEVTAAANDPTVLLGFMAHDYGSLLEVDIYAGDVLVFCALPGSTFWIKGTTDPTDDSAVGEEYGLVLSSGLPQVDLTETTTKVFTIHNADTTRNLYEVSVIATVAQLQ